MDREALIRATASLAHKKLCEGHVRAGKTYIKETSDSVWVQKHGSNLVDLCAVDLDGLPGDWRAERDAGASIAVDALLESIEKGREIDEQLIEEVSALLHNRWLERNFARASEIEKSQYSDLPETDKEKDRYFIRAAVEVFKSPHA